MPGLYPSLFSGVIANGATQYVGVPITNAFVAGLSVSWPDATSSATLTFETTNLDADAAPVTSATGWTQAATITGPTGAGAGSSTTSLPVGARRGRMKAVAAADTTLEVNLAAAPVAGAPVATSFAGPLTLTDALIITPEALKTADYAVQASDSIVIMQVTAGGTMTMEAAPVNGKMLIVRNVSSNTLTIARNGKNLNGSAADHTLASGASRIYWYQASLNGWYTASTS